MRLGVLLILTISPLAVFAYGQEEAPECMLARADAHWNCRTEDQQVEQAAALYRAVPEGVPETYEARWRLADHRGQTSRADFFCLGQESAAQAVASDPHGVEGHYWLGACAGLLAAEKHNVKSLELIQLAIQEMETVIRLQPCHGMTQYTLGVIYRQAPGWPFSVGNLQKSLTYARRAAALRTDMLLTHIGLAETLAALGCKTEARTELEKAWAFPGPEGQEPETADQKAEIQRLLNRFS